jgi:superfamily II DNA or RNA helicase
MDKLFKLARDLASPPVWSAGVELARNAEFYRDEALDRDERAWRVVRGPRDRVCRVVLSEENELWQCDCGSEDDPCAHVVGTILAVRQGREHTGVVRSGASVPATVVHSLTTSGAVLSFERAFVFGSDRVPVRTSLSQAISEAGRSNRTVSLTEAEERIDHALAGRYSGVLEPKTMRRLIPALSRVPHVEVDGQRCRVASEPLATDVEVVDESRDEERGFRVRRVPDPLIERIFDNSAAIRAGQLHAVEDSALSVEDVQHLRGEGTFFPISRGLELATRVIPTLQSKVRVVVRSSSVPRARRVTPRVVVETLADPSATFLTVVPHIVYGDPIIARVRAGELQLIDPREVPIRDPLEEGRLTRDVAMRLSLKVGDAAVFRGESGVHFARRLEGWATEGVGKATFTPSESLVPRAEGSRDGLDIIFETSSKGGADAAEVLQAWRRGESFAPLIGGGWGSIPREWLSAHGDALARLLEAKAEGRTVRPRALSDVVELCDSLDIACPDYFQSLRQYLQRVESIPNYPTPADLTVELRDYQRHGVNWLGLLRENDIGALLADDMGLGKTLQTLCVIQSGALIVCPTSVLSSWREQIARFRPSLSVCVFHGPQRVLREDCDVVLTSYALLRIDQEILCAREWSTVVLDEAQTIRNPTSQVAQAAYQLQGKMRISLSGTPVENSLDDLWSQFHFLNPGLLESYETFQERYSRAIEAGDAERSRKLKERVAPFILRRMKHQVAKELPPKTEVELQCDLSDQERVLYQSILGAARQEVVERLDSGEGVFSVLEILLRLRQACCHPSLLPGHSAASSSKVELLMDTLARSRAQRHRALVFSQWTSMLDLIEPHLEAASISFCRIDGSTADRGPVVERFQASDGPEVMLLSLKAGGVGLTLTAADHVFIVDPWWNPAVEDQAADRAYRIGQENPVLVHRLVTRDTIEERILELQRHKRSLLASALGSQTGPGLSRDELLALLVS